MVRWYSVIAVARLAHCGSMSCRYTASTCSELWTEGPLSLRERGPRRILQRVDEVADSTDHVAVGALRLDQPHDGAADHHRVGIRRHDRGFGRGRDAEADADWQAA